jgi:hypothetical protein
MKSPIYFKPGYKYQLQEDYVHILIGGCTVPLFHHSKYIVAVGTRVTVKAGYAWDGPSGPTYDSKSALRASLIHDTLYQLISEGILDDKQREAADNELYTTLLEDGVNKVRAYLWYLAVRAFGGASSTTQTRTEVAP